MQTSGLKFSLHSILMTGQTIVSLPLDGRRNLKWQLKDMVPAKDKSVSYYVWTAWLNIAEKTKSIYQFARTTDYWQARFYVSSTEHDYRERNFHSIL